MGNTFEIIDSMLKRNEEECNGEEVKEVDLLNNGQTKISLYPGLYGLIGAPSSGKTTFAVNLADNIAAAGREAIYFSMVNNADELVSKSLSGMTASISLSDAVTSLSIRQGDLSPVVLKAAGQYKEMTGNRISIYDSITDVMDISERVYRYNNPVVIIDSLQTIPLIEDELENPVQLSYVEILKWMKDLSGDCDATIIVVYNYCGADDLTPYSLSRMKDTDGFISCCDVIWNLQLENQRSPWEEIKKPCRDVKLVCLKDRYGQAGYTFSYKYYPAFDLFIQADPQI